MPGGSTTLRLSAVHTSRGGPEPDGCRAGGGGTLTPGGFGSGSSCTSPRGHTAASEPEPSLCGGSGGGVVGGMPLAPTIGGKGVVRMDLRGPAHHGVKFRALTSREKRCGDGRTVHFVGLNFPQLADLETILQRAAAWSTRRFAARAAHLRAHRAGAMSLLFTEQFAVTDAKPFFDKVTRLSCRLVEGEDLHLDLDVNSTSTRSR